MDKKQKKNLLIGVGVVVVVIIIFLLGGKNKDVDSPKNVESEDVVDKDTVPATGGVKTPAPASISYAEALVKYRNNRIQLDVACQASPNNVTYKNGTSIMIDNRSANSRVVKVGSIFNIKPWDFKIVKLSSSTLPVTWLVDCDKSQNVATILIQK